MKTKSNIFHASMLVVGTGVGCGVLALPIIAGMAGLISSLVVCVISCIMMATTGLIIGTKYIENDKLQSIQQFYESTLGKKGRLIANILFSLLSLLLIMAYINGMGSSIAESFAMKNSRISVLFVWIVFSGIMFCGSHRTKFLNSTLVIIKTLLFACLMIPCFKGFEMKNAQFINIVNIPALFPMFLASFGFHQTLPAICRQTKNKKHMTYAIILGILIMFLTYVVLLIACLGIIPQNGDKISIDYAFQNGLPVTIILGNIFKSKTLSIIALILPIVAMSTSLIGVTEGFTQFVHDGFGNVPPKNAILGAILVFVFAFLGLTGGLFVKAMVWVGVLASLLFGILPTIALLKDGIKFDSKPKIISGTILATAFAFVVCLQIYKTLQI